MDYNPSDDDIDRYADGALQDPTAPLITEDEFVADDALAALVTERTVYPERSNSQVAKAIFDRNSPLAAQAIVHMALHAKSDRSRLDAAKYIMDRALGKIGDEKANGSEDPLANFFKEITAYSEANARQ
jgi:hypothetical protein